MCQGFLYVEKPKKYGFFSFYAYVEPVEGIVKYQQKNCGEFYSLYNERLQVQIEILFVEKSRKTIEKLRFLFVVLESERLIFRKMIVYDVNIGYS